MRTWAFDVFSGERGRSSFLVTAWLLVLARLLLLSAPALGGEAPYFNDERTFTAHIAQLMTRALPAAKTQIKGPLTLTSKAYPMARSR
jgi:hypothetical protein